MSLLGERHERKQSSERLYPDSEGLSVWQEVNVLLTDGSKIASQLETLHSPFLHILVEPSHNLPSGSASPLGQIALDPLEWEMKSI